MADERVPSDIEARAGLTAPPETPVTASETTAASAASVASDKEKPLDGKGKKEKKKERGLTAGDSGAYCVSGGLHAVKGCGGVLLRRWAKISVLPRRPPGPDQQVQLCANASDQADSLWSVALCAVVGARLEVGTQCPTEHDAMQGSTGPSVMVPSASALQE